MEKRPNKVREHKSIEKQVQSLSLKEKIGQFFMPAAFINDSEEEIQLLETLIREHHIGGICFFHSRASAATNFEGKKKIIHNEKSLEVLTKLIRRYQNASQVPLLIAIDAEWGLAMRVENCPKYPYALTLGALQENTELIYQTAYSMGYECLQAGIHWNFAPVADINSNPENPVIGYRSFGSDEKKVEQKSLAFYKGIKESGCLSCGKHFPGHGDTATDSHLALPLIKRSREQLEAREIVPFKTLIDHNIPAIMVGHLQVPALDPSGLPATFSSPIIQEFLKDHLGFKGVVVSDALNMHAITKLGWSPAEIAEKAFHAGIDVLCFADAIPEAIESIRRNSSEIEINTRLEPVISLKEEVFSIQIEALRPPEPYPDLMQDLARESLTHWRGHSSFKAGEPYYLVEVGNKPSTFSEEFRENSASFYRHLEPETGTLEDLKDLRACKVLLSLHPPAAKPNLNFGFNTSVLELLCKLLEENTVILYIFGNPYMLNRLPYDSSAGIVLGYENLEAFQKNAWNYFKGKTKAPGRLAVELKSATDE